MTSQHPAVLFVGFDGLDHELWQRHNTQDVRILPLLAPVPVTGPSWTSIFTGDSMARHGVRDVFGLEFRRRYARSDAMHLLKWHLHNLGRQLRGKQLRQRELTYATTPSTYIWDRLGPEGIRFKNLNLPITCPVRPINGVHVGGFPLLSGKPICYPPDLSAKLPDDYAAVSDIIQALCDPQRDSHRLWKNRAREMGPDAVMDDLTRSADRLLELFLDLPAADVEMIQFSFVDRIGHLFGQAGELETQCYAMVNRLVEALVEARKPESVMIVSDHGFQGDDHTDVGCLGLAGTLRDRVHVEADYMPCVLDVAPTLAGVLGKSHPCEGNDLTVREARVTRRDPAEEKEKAELMKQLRDLGYL